MKNRVWKLLTLIWCWDLMIIAAATAAYSILLGSLDAKIDITGPVLGVAGTLAALALPAAALGGSSANDVLQYWLGQIDAGTWPRDRIISELERSVRQLRGLWRAFMWLFASLVVAAVAATRAGDNVLSVPVWRLLTGLAVALIVMAVGRLVPGTWLLLRLDTAEHVSDLAKSSLAAAAPAPSVIPPKKT
jgi:hypothetical protein